MCMLYEITKSMRKKFVMVLQPWVTSQACIFAWVHHRARWYEKKWKFNIINSEQRKHKVKKIYFFQKKSFNLFFAQFSPIYRALWYKPYITCTPGKTLLQISSSAPTFLYGRPTQFTKKNCFSMSFPLISRYKS